MRRDAERTERIARALAEAGLDAVVCALPANVLLLTGYYPVVGTSVAVATRDGVVQVIAPEDEKGLAARGRADKVLTFSAGSLDGLLSASEAVRAPLREALKSLGVGRGSVVGYEAGEWFETAPYAALHLYGSRVHEMLARDFPFTALLHADDLLTRLRASLTWAELDGVRAACRLAGDAFTVGARALCAGLKETDAASLFRAPLCEVGECGEGPARADGFVYCMSGPNSAKAYAAYQRSRSRRIAEGDLVLVHCNSYADGYWTDITRTFCVGEADVGKRRMYEAVFAARRAALACARPGVAASEVDAAARQVMTTYGFGKEFKHGLGHGVGFAAINHNAPPRLHPASTDVLEAGMVFNVEPAIYFEGCGGMRHCDMVVVTEEGAEVLTPFQASVEELTIS
ncbi:MAG: Xaa-Pro peptidase family protein [Acidobacteriota bacterium]|nr:Xaa-Pro peptidase family protein [Acidobacteriota bacterium]